MDLNDPRQFFSGPVAPTGKYDAPDANVQEPVATSDELETDDPAGDSVLPDDTAPGEEVVSEEGITPEAEPESDATSEEDGEANEPEESGDASEDGEWFLKTEHSQYRTKEDVERGIDAKDRFILSLREEKERVTVESETKITDLASRLEQAESKLNKLSSRVPEAEYELLEIQDHLPEAFRGKSEADFEEDEERVAYKAAVLDARAQYRAEQKRLKEEAESLDAARKSAEAQAQEWVKANANDKAFDARNLEEKDRLEKFLSGKAEEDSPYARRQEMEYIVAAFGEKAGRTFLAGLRAEFAGGVSRGTTPKVKETVVQTKIVSKQPVPPPKKETVPMSGREMAAFEFARSAPRARR